MGCKTMEGGASEFRELNSTVTRRGRQPEAAGNGDRWSMNKAARRKSLKRRSCGKRPGGLPQSRMERRGVSLKCVEELMAHKWVFISGRLIHTQKFLPRIATTSELSPSQPRNS